MRLPALSSWINSTPSGTISSSMVSSVLKLPPGLLRTSKMIPSMPADLRTASVTTNSSAAACVNSLMRIYPMFPSIISV